MAKLKNYKTSERNISGGNYNSSSFALARDITINNGCFGELSFMGSKDITVKDGFFEKRAFNESEDITITGGTILDYSLMNTKKIRITGGQLMNNICDYSKGIKAYTRGPIESLSNINQSTMIIEELGELIITDEFTEYLRRINTRLENEIYCVRIREKDPKIKIISQEIFALPISDFKT